MYTHFDLQDEGTGLGERVCVRPLRVVKYVDACVHWSVLRKQKVKALLSPDTFCPPGIPRDVSFYVDTAIGTDVVGRSSTVELSEVPVSLDDEVCVILPRGSEHSACFSRYSRYCWCQCNENHCRDSGRHIVSSVRITTRIPTTTIDYGKLSIYIR